MQLKSGSPVIVLSVQGPFHQPPAVYLIFVSVFPHFNSEVILTESLKFLFAAVLDSTCVQPEPNRTDCIDGGSLITCNSFLTFTYRIVIPFQFSPAYAHLIQVPFHLIHLSVLNLH